VTAERTQAEPNSRITAWLYLTSVYIDGNWIDAGVRVVIEVRNPATRKSLVSHLPGLKRR